MRKKMIKSFLKLSICVLILFVMAGCAENTVDVRTPLFSVTKPVYKSNSEDDRCALGGVYFDFYNKADCCVTYIEIRMNVYDKKTGKAAFTGYGTIKSEISVVIKSGEIHQMCIPLDQYITVVSKDGYLIDRFYVSRIEYEDGKVWLDELGLYSSDSKE